MKQKCLACGDIVLYGIKLYKHFHCMSCAMMNKRGISNIPISVIANEMKRHLELEKEAKDTRSSRRNS